MHALQTGRRLQVERARSYDRVLVRLDQNGGAFDMDVTALGFGNPNIVAVVRQASGATIAAQAEQQLDGLGAAVQSLFGLARAVIDSPVGYRAVVGLQRALTDMGNALAAGRFAIVASAGIELTV